MVLKASSGNLSANGTVQSVGTGTGLTGGPITTSGNISLANTAVTAGVYGNATLVPQITVDAQGRITLAANVAISVAAPVTLKSSAAQAITSNTTLRDLTGFNFPIAAGANWSGQAMLRLGGGLSSTGVKVAMTVPAGANMALGVGIVPNGINIAGTNSFYDEVSGSGVATDFDGTDLGAVSKAMAICTIYVANGANAGQVALQGAQSASSGTALTFNYGSVGLVTQGS